MLQQKARVIMAIAAERDDDFIWNRLQALQPEMFAAGPVAVKLGYYGAEGARPVRPFIASRWTTDADDLADLLDKARTRCVCGCYVRIGDILEQALQETRQGAVQAVVIVGDHFYGDLDAAITAAKQLAAAGTRLFLFQQGDSDSTERSFRLLAETTGGAYFPLNPHVERVAERLPGLLEAVTHFTLGGMAALEARGDEAASLLLEQMNASNQIAR